MQIVDSGESGYIVSKISKDEEIEEDVKYKIRAGWLKWKRASRVLGD